MKKLLFSTIVFILFLSVSNAQSIENFVVSEPFIPLNCFYKKYFTLDDKVFIVNAGKGKIALQLFDPKEMKEIKNNVFPLESGQVIENVMILDGKFYLFYSKYDKPNLKEQLFCCNIDVENCTLINNPIKLITTKRKIRSVEYEVVKEGRGVKFNFNTSYDKTKLLIQYRLEPLNKDNSLSFDEMGMYVFDNKLNQLSGDDFVMPFTEKEMDNVDFSIDTKGNSYMLIYVLNKENCYSILEIPFGAKEYKKSVLTEPKTDINNTNNQNYFYDAKFFETASGEMSVGGLYFKGKEYGIDGFYFIKVSDMANSTIFYKIPIEVRNQYEDEKKIKENSKNGVSGINDLELRDIIVNSDGSILINAEQNSVKSYDYSFYNGTPSSLKTYNRTLINYNSIFVAKIDKAGALAWVKKIPKCQQSNEIPVGYTYMLDAPLLFMFNGAASYKYIKIGNKLCYLFFDDEKNQNIQVNKVPEKYYCGRTGRLFAYTIDETTNEVKQSIYFSANVGDGWEVVKFNINKVFPISENEIGVGLYESKKTNKDLIIKVKIE